MLIRISSFALILGILQGVSGEECPPLDSLRCLSVPTRCMSSVRANLTLSDNTTCPGCRVCIRYPPSLRNPGRFRGNDHCPPRFCPMWIQPDGCKLHSQWVEVDGIICHVCGTWRCN